MIRRAFNYILFKGSQCQSIKEGRILVTEIWFVRTYSKGSCLSAIGTGSLPPLKVYKDFLSPNKDKKPILAFAYSISCSSASSKNLRTDLSRPLLSVSVATIYLTNLKRNVSGKKRAGHFLSLSVNGKKRLYLYL